MALEPVTQAQIEAIPLQERMAAAVEALKQLQAVFPEFAQNLTCVIELLS
jgi:hypothetical protein